MEAPFVVENPPNQSPPFVDRNLYREDLSLKAAVQAAGEDAEAEGLEATGAACGSFEAFDLGRLANENPPRLHSVDARGARLDEVEFHPAYHELMRRSVKIGLHGSVWRRDVDGRIVANGHVARAARLYMTSQVESGHVCPLSMTNASMAALVAAPDVASAWAQKIAGREYDPRLKPWWEKSAVTIGMGMTEAQGGTDVRANASEARRAGDHYEIVGAKWFMSAPMCDAFLVLAQAPGGLTAFLLPRFRPDGSRNALHFQRLKEKLGNKSNASSEVVFARAYGERVGEEGRGVATIIEMVQFTRLDCVVAAAGHMRYGLALAVHHASSRRAFQRRLVEQPLMRSVLADLALESRAATALAFRVARAFDSPNDPAEVAYARLVTPAAKYLVCKGVPGFVAEALECLGGNGYVEDWPMARLYREAPLNAIWEGAGNVMALDLARAASRGGEATSAVIADLGRRGGRPAEADALIVQLRRGAEGELRLVCERLARLAATAALAETAPEIADLHARARADGGRVHFGARTVSSWDDALIAEVFEH